jgi:hypothetical protein
MAHGARPYKPKLAQILRSPRIYVYQKCISHGLVIVILRVSSRLRCIVFALRKLHRRKKSHEKMLKRLKRLMNSPFQATWRWFVFRERG